MKIRMKKLAAGPAGVMRPGKIYEVEAKTGKELLDGNYAEEIKEPKKPAAKVETTDAEPAAEKRSKNDKKSNKK